MNRIKEVLEEKGIKQTWLAEQLGKSYNMVNGYVQNRQQPRIEVLYEIAEILGVSERVAKVEIKDDRAIVNEAESIYGRNVATISTMKYSDFLKELSKILNINLTTIHQSIIDAGTDINKHLNPITLRIIKDKFDHFLMANAIDKLSIEYKKVSNNIHPTKLTDENGNALSEISASDIGIFFSDEDVAQSYFFDELYYDSELEMKNIKTEINEVIVFTKIPKNSIKIPVAGGKTYSPDFAYVLKFKDGKQKLNFIVETKDVGSDDGLREEEKAKIKHAEKFFGGQVKIEFKTQFTNNKIVDLIKEIINITPTPNPLWGGKVVYHIDYEFINKIGGLGDMKNNLSDFYFSKLGL